MFGLSKIQISWKLAKKGNFEKCLDPFWGFILKTVLGIHDPHISWLLFGTKNHEMRGPPVLFSVRNWFACFARYQQTQRKLVYF